MPSECLERCRRVGPHQSSISCSCASEASSFVARSFAGGAASRASGLPGTVLSDKSNVGFHALAAGSCGPAIAYRQFSNEPATLEVHS